MKRTLLFLLPGLLVVGAPHLASAQLERLIVTSGVRGDLGRPCAPSAERAVPAWTASAPGLRIDTGGLLASSSLARFAAESAPEALATLVRALGYNVLGLSEGDLADERDLLEARLDALQRVGIPVLATNLQCDEGVGLCGRLLTSRLVRGRESGAAFLSLIDPAVLTRIAPDRREGLRLLPLASSLRDGVRAARARGAPLVVAIVNGGDGAEAFATAIEAASDLADEDKPDLILSGGAGSELLFARPAGRRPALVGAPAAGAATVDVRDLGSRFDVLTTPLEAPAQTPAALQRFLRDVGPAYCEALARELAGGELERAMTPSDLASLLAAIMRQTHDADLGIVNEAVLDRRWTGAEGTLRRLDLEQAVLYDEPVVVANVPGTWLRSLARRSLDGLTIPGLSVTNPGGVKERITVHGRLLEVTATYRVATIRYLAGGGDGFLTDAANWESTEDSLRSLAIAHLSEPADVDPRDAIDEPADALEWAAQVDASLAFSGNAIRDRAEYNEGPLANQGQAQLSLTTTLRLNATSRNAAWENEVIATYALARTDDEGSFDEGTDQLTYRTSAQLRRLRRRFDHFYVPDFIAEGFLRTEFTPEAEDHFLNVRFVAGPQFRPIKRITLRAVGGVEVINAVSDERRTEPGAGAQLAITSFPLLVDLPRRLTVDASVDYFASGLGGDVRHLVQGRFAFQLSLTQSFGLDFNVNLYGLKEDGGPFAFALATSAGIRVGFAERWLSR
ncbi:MAG: 5'-nucleotidase C-terminal domain-containing protein [Myxococcota bacterium]